eukprot:TRINITY_DN7849_c0_g7_i1.p1 TRINITY_DN7849_c0_g7~~TRINITY_DN7849_c0_g7_i1.p1  ORF type:complete len:824 (-),score=95.94 TRINITY_DN7849_c0_g7_i1:14-2485(-)
MWPLINATAVLRVAGRPLRARTEVSPSLNDEAYLTLKAAPQDVFFGILWDYFGGMGAGGTLQTRRLESLPLEKRSSCWVCENIYGLLRRSALLSTGPADLRVIIAEFEAASVIFNRTTLEELLFEGWGFSFSWTLLRLIAVAHQLGFAASLPASPMDYRQSRKYLSFFIEALTVGWPVSQLAGGVSKENLPSFVDFEHARNMLVKADQKLKRHFRWSSNKDRTWWWLHKGTERWLSLFLGLSVAWNSGGAISRQMSPSLAWSGDLLIHNLVRVTRAERDGWSVAVVAASVVEDEWTVRELELQVVPQKLSDVGMIQNGSISTSAFKSNIPNEANFMIAFCLWPSRSRGRGIGQRQPDRKVQCRIFSQSGVYSGCREFGKLECEGTSHPVSSLRVRCAVPWDELLLPNRVSNLKLILESPESTSSVRQPSVVVSVGFALRTLPRQPLRPELPAAARGRVAMCLPPAFGYADVERRWGDLIGDWLKYHFDVLGVGHVFLYDNDGSLRDAVRRSRRIWPCGGDAVRHAGIAGTTDACAHAGIVHYEPDFPARVYGRKIWNESCSYCAENIAYDHCLINSRGLVDYVVILHGLDEWLVPALERITSEPVRASAPVATSTSSVPGSATPGSTDTTSVSDAALQNTSAVATSPCVSSTVAPLFDLAADLDGLQPFTSVGLFRANLHSFGASDQSSFGLIKRSLSRLANQAGNFTDMNIIPPSSIVKSRGVTYVDTHFLSFEAEESLKVIRNGVITLKNWRVNHYLDSMGPPRFLVAAKDGSSYVVPGKPNSYENYTTDEVLLQHLLASERSCTLRRRDARLAKDDSTGK